MRQYNKYRVRSLSYTGQAQDTYKFNAAGRFAELILVIKGVATTTTGTLYPSFAQVANLLKKIRVYDNQNQTLVNLSGLMAYAKFNWVNGCEADNASLPGGANTSGGALRQTLRIPFELDDGADPQDTLLDNIAKELTLELQYNAPGQAGTLFGDVTGLSAVSFDVEVSLVSYRLPQDHRLTGRSAPARSLIEEDIPLTATSDEFRLDVPEDQTYRGIHMLALEFDNGRWVNTAAALNQDKLLAVKSTRNSNVIHSDLVRNFRNETVQRRGVQTLPAGIIDIPLIRNGRLNQTIRSDKADRLYLEVPSVLAGNPSTNPRRVIVLSDTIRAQ